MPSYVCSAARGALLLLSCMAFLFADAPDVFAIHNARIVPVSGPAISRGTVVVRNGLIEAVGPDVTAPADAWVIEGDGLTVYPGLIDSLSTLGIPSLAPAAPVGAATGTGGQRAAVAQAAATTAPAAIARGPEDRPSTTSWLRAADEVRPTDPRLNAARFEGFTTAVTFPERGIFAGQGAVIDLAGERPGEMVVTAPAGQYVTFQNAGFGSGFPASLMGAIAYVRQVFLDANYYREARNFYGSHARTMPRPSYDRALEGVLDSPRFLLPAARRTDVDRMLRFSHELKLNSVLYGLPEGYRSADLLKDGSVPVLVSLKWPARGREADPEEQDPLQVLEVRGKAPSTPAVLAKNGVRFALYADGLTRRADFLKAVHEALDAGLSHDDAIRALTLAPAQIYGVDDRLGSIEPGKIANLVVTKGDLLDTAGHVEFVVIDGNKYEPTPEPAEPAPGTRADRALPTENAGPDDLPVRTPQPAATQPPQGRPPARQPRGRPPQQGPDDLPVRTPQPPATQAPPARPAPPPQSAPMSFEGNR